MELQETISTPTSAPCQFKTSRVRGTLIYFCDSGGRIGKDRDLGERVMSTVRPLRTAQNYGRRHQFKLSKQNSSNKEIMLNLTGQRQSGRLGMNF
jgi:hypothetical protein